MTDEFECCIDDDWYVPLAPEYAEAWLCTPRGLPDSGASWRIHKSPPEPCAQQALLPRSLSRPVASPLRGLPETDQLQGPPAQTHLALQAIPTEQPHQPRWWLLLPHPEGPHHTDPESHWTGGNREGERKGGWKERGSKEETVND